MLPRKPTRLELKQDDLQEYEKVKRERAQKAAMAAAQAAAGGAAAGGAERPRTTAERIGLIKK